MTLTNTDKVRDYLQTKSNGVNYISIGDLSDFIVPSGMDRGSFMSAFYNLRERGEVDTDIAKSEGGRKTVKGIKLLKMASVSTIIRNDAEKTKTTHKSKPLQVIPEKKLEHTSNYLNQKRVLAEIIAKLEEAGFDPETTINFTPNPIGEETIYVLDLLERAQTAINDLTKERDTLSIELVAEREITKRYAGKLKLTPEEL